MYVYVSMICLYQILTTFITVYENAISFDTRSVTFCGMTHLISCTQLSSDLSRFRTRYSCGYSLLTLYCLKLEILVPASQIKDYVIVTKTNRVMLCRVMVS
jgi:hypothetical protein